LKLPVRIHIGVEQAGYELEDIPEGECLTDADKVLLIREVVPCTFPALSLGIPLKSYYLADLSYSSELRWDSKNGAYVTTERNVMNKFMAISRIAGYDVVAKNGLSHTPYKNWATTCNGHYLPAFTSSENITTYYYIKPQDIVKREHNWIDIPKLNEFVRLSIDMKLIHFTIIGDGKIIQTLGEVFSAFEYQPPNKSTTLLSNNILKAAYIPIAIPSFIADFKMQDFHKLEDPNLSEAFTVLFA
jgi:hypothetical protein